MLLTATLNYTLKKIIYLYYSRYCLQFIVHYLNWKCVYSRAVHSPNKKGFISDFKLSFVSSSKRDKMELKTTCNSFTSSEAIVTIIYNKTKICQFLVENYNMYKFITTLITPNYMHLPNHFE